MKMYCEVYLKVYCEGSEGVCEGVNCFKLMWFSRELEKHIIDIIVLLSNEKYLNKIIEFLFTWLLIINLNQSQYCNYSYLIITQKENFL